MQCFSDLNLQCCDCKSRPTFVSATRLLQHFAHHVQKEVRAKDGVSKKRKKKVADEVESSSESSQTLSASSSSSDSSSRDQMEVCKLAKFDLQKRLETCVSIKKELESDSIVSVKMEKQEETDGKESLNVSSDTKGSEEYSPLKFCMITMEESDGNDDPGSPKKVASRKQLLPKKIERKMEGLRKIAPKAENFASEPLLQSHGRKKYACHLCTKVFGWSTDLKRHILVHTGERPFKCENCQATFTRNFLLQKHQSKVHPCKPKDPVEVKPEPVEIPNVNVTNGEEDFEVDPLKEEPAESNDEDDENKLVITEELDEKPLNSSLSNSSSDSSWHIMPTSSDRRCSNMNQSDMFSVTPIKVLTI